MPEPTVDNASATTAPAVYNPLSMLAVLGLGCSALYAGILVMSAVVALRSGAPLLLPDWLLLLPVAGAGLALLALRQIRNSEGTLAGTKLSVWGLFLGGGAALAYGAYYLATGFAVQQQANNFLMNKGEESGFFALLQEDQVERAFLLTVRHRERKNKNPEDRESMAPYEQALDLKDPRGMLAQFAEQDIIQRIIQAGREKKAIQALGVRSWKYEKGEYEVERGYRIETAEMSVDILVTVHSNDNDAPGEARRWNVAWDKTRYITNPEYTDLGKKIMLLRNEAGRTFAPWVDKLGLAKLTKPTPDRGTDWSSSALSMSAEGMQKKISQEIKALFQAKDKTLRQIKMAKNPYVPWKEDDGHLEFTFPIFVDVPATAGPQEPRYTAEIHIYVRSAEPVRLSEFNPEANLEAQLPTFGVVAYKVIQLRDVPQPNVKKMGGP